MSDEQRDELSISYAEHSSLVADAVADARTGYVKLEDYEAVVGAMRAQINLATSLTGVGISDTSPLAIAQALATGLQKLLPSLPLGKEAVAIVRAGLDMLLGLL